MNFIFDVHLDLSLNALEWNRDLTLPLSQIRKLETGMNDLKGRAENTVCFEEMRKGGIGLCVATQIGGCMKPAGPVASWESPSQAWAMTQGQRAYYEALEDIGELRKITDLIGLENHLETWKDPEAAASRNEPIGYMMSLEGADSIIDPSYLEKAYESGLRAIGPAHYGCGRYALGHDQVGGLPAGGKELIQKIDELGMILDVTHLSDLCFFEALEIFSGPVWASHSNCRTLVDDPRQFSDEQIHLLIERDAVIGCVLDAWMMVPGWKRESSTPESMNVRLEHIAKHIDHICQLAGNTNHVGIGSDLDGGFGREQAPLDLDSIADLQNLEQILGAIGFNSADLDGFFHENFLGVVRRAWS